MKPKSFAAYPLIPAMALSIFSSCNGNKENTDYGTLSIGDVNAWVGYPASEFFPKAEGAAAGKTIAFRYDASKITVDAAKNTVQALAAGTHRVTATIDGAAAEFSVRSFAADRSSNRYNTSAYDAKAALLAQKWVDDGGGSATTLFIGDSFFDAGQFWTNFYSTYAGKDALCFGISATTSYDWDIYLGSWVGKLNPKNVVMHIGTNNVYDDGDQAADAVLSLQRLFTLMHGKLPESRIYYFGISQRSYDTAKIGIVNTVNTVMKAWCGERSWITYLDTPGKLTNDMLKDNVHPKIEYYSVFTNELASAGLVMAAKAASATIADITRAASQAIGNNPVTLLYKGAGLTADYILKGKTDITALGTNAHLECGFPARNDNCRMLLWNNASDNKLKTGYIYNGAGADVPVYDFIPGQTLTLDFELVSSGGNAFLYINGDPVLVFAKPAAGPIGISSEAMGCRIYGMTAVSKEFDAGEFAARIAPFQQTIDAYSDKVAGAYRP